MSCPRISIPSLSWVVQMPYIMILGTKLQVNAQYSFSTFSLKPQLGNGISQYSFWSKKRDEIRSFKMILWFWFHNFL